MVGVGGLSGRPFAVVSTLAWKRRVQTQERSSRAGAAEQTAPSEPESLRSALERCGMPEETVTRIEC